jgi:hypothetical protein
MQFWSKDFWLSGFWAKDFWAAPEDEVPQPPRSTDVTKIYFNGRGKRRFWREVNARKSSSDKYG